MRAFVFIMLFGLGCGGMNGDVGLDAELHVAGSQLHAGDLEAIAVTGPSVISVFNSLTTVQPAERDKPLTGMLDPAATAAAIGLRGDRGFFIVEAGPPALDAPEQPTFAATLSFSPELAPGPRILVVRAVDGAGNFGAPAIVPLTVTARPTPTGTLVVSLRWDSESDLDLHVVVPGGVEVWARNFNSYQLPPPGTSVDPTAWRQGGILDFDSNAGCVIDGRRQESVVWQGAPPAGTYLVRVDTASLCGTADARWSVEVLENGVSLGASEGESLPTDGRFSKGLGSGVEALTFDVSPP